MSEPTVDEQARQQAREAQSTAERAQMRVDAHESLCAERWAQNQKSADETRDAVSEAKTAIDALSKKVSEGFKELYGRDRNTTTAAILLLLGIVGYLFVKAYG